MRTLRLGTAIARAWGLHRMALAVMVTVLGWWSVRGALPVPGRLDVRNVVWPLLPAVLAAVTPSTASVVYRDLERSSGRALVTSRIAVVAILLTCSALLTAVAAIWYPWSLVGRNLALLVGVALLGTVLAPNWARGMLPVLLAIGTWLIGSPPPGWQPPGWAILLHPEGSETAAGWAVALLLAGAVSYVALETPVMGPAGGDASG